MSLDARHVAVLACVVACGCGPGDTQGGAGDGSVRDSGMPWPGGADAGSPGSVGPHDRIYGVHVARHNAWWVSEEGQIHHRDAPVTLRGVNWYGLETPDRAPHGLWTGRTIRDFVEQVAGLGFNALRLPVSPESIRPGFPAADWVTDGSPSTGRALFEEVLEEARAAGLYVLPVIHTCDSEVGSGRAPSPVSCGGYDIGDWTDDLQVLAGIVRDDPHVIGIDLFNEPHGLTWSRWRELVERGGEAVLQQNPRVLVFIEGVGNTGGDIEHPTFWGENLIEAGDAPPDLPPSRIVYAPHVYGPSVAPQAYFDARGYPDNLPPIWHAHFGHLADDDVALVIGEFGGWYDDARLEGSVAWQDRFVRWMQQNDIEHFFYWALNPDSSDTGGVLLDDWRTPHRAKLELLRPLLQ